MSNTPRTDKALRSASGLFRAAAEANGMGHLARQLERELAEAQNRIASLENGTRWQCSCGGTDCEWIEENKRLRADFDSLKKFYAVEQESVNRYRDQAIKLRAELETLRNSVNVFITCFRLTRWGWDGDCGTGALVDTLEDAAQKEPAP